MPRYFFHVDDDGEVRDTEGTMLSGPSEARAEAIRACGDMVKECGTALFSLERWQMRVVDEAGRNIVRLSVRAETGRSV